MRLYWSHISGAEKLSIQHPHALLGHTWQVRPAREPSKGARSETPSHRKPSVQRWHQSESRESPLLVPGGARPASPVPSSLYNQPWFLRCVFSPRATSQILMQETRLEVKFWCISSPLGKDGGGGKKGRIELLNSRLKNLSDTSCWFSHPLP